MSEQAFTIEDFEHIPQVEGQEQQLKPKERGLAVIETVLNETPTTLIREITIYAKDANGSIPHGSLLFTYSSQEEPSVVAGDLSLLPLNKLKRYQVIG